MIAIMVKRTVKIIGKRIIVVEEAELVIIAVTVVFRNNDCSRYFRQHHIK
jgi:hypothetical protein